MADETAAPSPDLVPENVWDYPRPPRLEPVPQRLTVVLNGAVLADSVAGFRVLETSHPPTYYLPPTDVALERLQTVPGRSICEWKGRARYVGPTDGPLEGRAVGWVYDEPTAAFTAIAGYYAFYPGLCDRCTVADRTVIPQEGDFYGGWLTDNLTGPFKGGAGTWGW